MWSNILKDTSLKSFCMPWGVINLHILLQKCPQIGKTFSSLKDFFHPCMRNEQSFIFFPCVILASDKKSSIFSPCVIQATNQKSSFFSPCVILATDQKSSIFSSCVILAIDQKSSIFSSCVILETDLTKSLPQGWATSGFFRNSGFFFLPPWKIKKKPEPGKLTIFLSGKNWRYNPTLLQTCH